jgi:hypothetical protein
MRSFSPTDRAPDQPASQPGAAARRSQAGGLEAWRAAACQASMSCAVEATLVVPADNDPSPDTG